MYQSMTVAIVSQESTFHSGYITMDTFDFETGIINESTFHSGYITINYMLEPSEAFNESTFHSGYITIVSLT